LLARKVMEAGVERFVEKEALELFFERVRFAELPAPDLAGCVEELCMGLNSFAGFREAAKHLPMLLEQRAGSQRLAELAPVSVRLPGGRQTKVYYEAGRPPWIASRLQDFFGMEAPPRIGPARTPLVVHLLAPNHRAVQTTTDLAGFWERLYPQVRKELMRRYPRHAWPELSRER
jgi:ATP-dependent helicase HrpB